MNKLIMEAPKSALDGSGDKPESQDLVDSQDTLPATQELIDSVEVETQSLEMKGEPLSDERWGTLIPMIENLECVELRGKSFRVGRSAARCHVIIKDHHLPVTDPKDENMKIDKVSRVMFEVFKTRNAFGVEDFSKNGTFVNNIKVGNNNKQPLRDADTIGIIDENLVLYTFISEKGPRARFPAALCDIYLMGAIVGEGSTCTVYVAWRRTDILKMAIKVINKGKWPTKYSAPTDLMKEVNILKNLDHPGITKVLEVIEASQTVNIVMEFAEGGELFDQVQEDLSNGMLDESVAKFQFYQICTTIEYLHSMKVCHRDLKLENLLLDRKDRKGQIKVSDFGLSKVSSETSVLETFVGTPVYMAPEIICAAETGKSYSLKSDCWSLGVILYTLMSATQPFRQDLGEKTLHKQIMLGKYCRMRGPIWDKISTEGKELVDALLTVDPNDRLSSREVLDHTWFTNDRQLCGEARMRLFSGIGKADSGLGMCVKTISNSLEALTVIEEVDRDKRKGSSLYESNVKKGNKRLRMETKDYTPVYVIDSD